MQTGQEGLLKPDKSASESSKFKTNWIKALTKQSTPIIGLQAQAATLKKLKVVKALSKTLTRRRDVSRNEKRNPKRM